MINLHKLCKRLNDLATFSEMKLGQPRRCLRQIAEVYNLQQIAYNPEEETSYWRTADGQIVGCVESDSLALHIGEGLGFFPNEPNTNRDLAGNEPCPYERLRQLNEEHKANAEQ